jgi:hypothetical protein
VARDDPFAGIRLSEQTSDSKLDQRLFSEPKAVPAQPKVSTPASADQSELPQNPQMGAQGSLAAEAPSLKPSSIASPRFDLKEQALYKATFVFTQKELEGLEDLKLELHRELDAKITKYDLVRCALHMLLEDYAANADLSYVTRKMKMRAK